MKYTNLQYRIKDSVTGKHLTKMARSVNYVWNYCNQANQERWSKFGKVYSNYELHSLTSGCTKELGLHASTIQGVCDEYVKNCKQFKRVKLRWRSSKRILGWIPFKAQCVKVQEDSVIYYGHKFKFWNSRPVNGKVRFGSFVQDSQGKWYVNFAIESEQKIRVKTGKEVGLDLGLKTIATLSDGNEFSRENFTIKYEKQLSKAQRANKKKLARAIHKKIKNKRRDWNHKTTTILAHGYDKIVVGDVSSKKLTRTRMAKSVQDASWSSFKHMLEYKAISLGVEIKVVNESFSTVTCSHCGSRTGPRGKAGLRVREWMCLNCNMTHNRDVNAAINILFSVQDIERQLRESTRVSQ